MAGIGRLGLMSGRILLVEDEAGVREAVQTYLSDRGLMVAVASNGLEGWEKLQQHPPELVISDIRMPKMDGYEFIQHLRADSRFKSLPVVFLTARGMTGDRISGYQAGCDAYLAKPFDPEELEAIVQNLLSRQQRTDKRSKLNLISQQIADIRNVLLDKPPTSLSSSPGEIALTPKETSVLALVVEGRMNKEIASRLNVGMRTVEKHLSNLRRKTDTATRTELVRFALERNLV